MHEKKAPIPDVPTRAIILHYPHVSHTATTVRLLSIERKAQHRLDGTRQQLPIFAGDFPPPAPPFIPKCLLKNPYASRTIIRAS